MRVHLKAFVIALLLCFAANSAGALPAPLSDEELLERSDLVALVRVLS
jgi:hypothetical protein